MQDDETRMKLHDMSLDSDDEIVSCERPNCKWEDSKHKLVSHIGRAERCKSFYGERLTEMKKDARAESKKKSRDKSKEKKSLKQISDSKDDTSSEVITYKYNFIYALFNIYQKNIITGK